MNALFLKDLAAKTRRGLRGRVEAGRSGGGLCYGYDVVREFDAANQPVYGKRRGNDAQANVVRRICADYAGGRSPRAIAKALNAEGVAGPSGKAWTASTIHGNHRRGTGVLNNELYVGPMIWNRLHYAKDPETGKRISKLNTKSQWITIDVPVLRVIDEQLWNNVKRRQSELEVTERSEKIRNTLNARHRARYLLSGLLTCGVCGAGYTLVGNDRYACANHVNRGTCTNIRTVSRKTIERRVLFSDIKDKLVTPELIGVFVREFTEEWNRQTASDRKDRAVRDAELAEVNRRIAQVMDAIEQGIITATTKDRLLELEAKREGLTAGMAKAAATSPPPALHPNSQTSTGAKWPISRRRSTTPQSAARPPWRCAVSSIASCCILARSVVRFVRNCTAPWRR
jgi:site-specific DNA recombinase